MAKYLFFIVFLSSQSVVANVIGSDIQNFNPNTNGLEFVTVHPSATLNPLQFNVGTFLDYSRNSLAYVTGAPDDAHFYSNLHFAIGLMQGWDLGIATNIIHAQDVGPGNFLFSYGDTGINEFRINSKVRLINTEAIGVAFVAGVDFEQIQANPFAGDNQSPTVNFEAVFDWALSSRWLWAVNLGYRLRQEGTPIPNRGITPISDQFIYSSALSYRTDDDGSAIIGEVYGSAPLEFISLPTDRQANNLEGLLGYRWRTTQAFDLHSGVGTKLINGLGSPDFRFYLGFNLRLGFLDEPYDNTSEPYRSYETQPKEQDKDGDGVPDPIDQCEATPPGVKVDERGCLVGAPPSQTTANPNDLKDTDGDSIPDSMDNCAGTPPGTKVNGFGCEIKTFEN